MKIFGGPVIDRLIILAWKEGVSSFMGMERQLSRYRSQN